MAQRVDQTSAMHQEFRRAIQRKERERRKDAVGRLEREHPLLGPIVAPHANVALFDEDNRNWLKGYAGETAVARMLRRLPEPWCYLNDAVFGRTPGAPGEYMQVDHIAVGPGGVVVIETKRWRGAVQGHRDVWKVKTGRGWVRLEGSPTRQAVWHARDIARHLRASGVAVPVAAAVVFVQPDLIRHRDCSCPVFDDARDLRSHLLALGGQGHSDAAACRAIAALLAGTSRLAPDGEVGAPRAPSPRAQGGAPPGSTGVPATERQRADVARLLREAGMEPAAERLAALTRGEAQAVIDRLRFKKGVGLPEGPRQRD